MKIGDLQIDNPVFLAPMAGVSDYPYRQIIRDMGCQLLYTEMVSSKGIAYGNEKTEELVEYNKKDGFIAVQIFGEDPAFMASAAAHIQEKYAVNIIDINMGCPTNKIVKNGSGSALMKDLKKAGSLIKAVVTAVDIPVTVKIRKGWDDRHINAVETAMLAEEMGVKAVAVHGRTREEFYSGKADWQIIKAVKEKVHIPVIGNGDIFQPEDAVKMIEETNCDAVMIARGVQGNPWLIKRAVHAIKTGELLDEPTDREIIEMALYHLKKSVDFYAEKRAIPLMRKHLSWYLKGRPYSSKIKEKLNYLKSYRSVKEVLQDYLMKLSN